VATSNLLKILFTLLISVNAVAEEIDWQSEEMLGNVLKGELGTIEDINIKFQKVDRELMGEMLTGVKLEWPHPSKKDCCSVKLVDETSGGIDSLKLKDNVVTLVTNAEKKKLSRCWKLNKEKTEFTALKKCPK
jgi:hypothetical protein